MSAFLRLAGLAGAGAMLLAAACTSILGKFTAGPGTGGGSGIATTGSTGHGGGTGGAPPAPFKFDCSNWKSPAHQQLATTEMAQGATLDHPRVVASDQDHPLVFARQTSAAAGMSLLVLNPNDLTNTAKVSVRDILSVKRLTPKSTGALVLFDAQGKLEMRMLEFIDGQPAAMPGVYTVVSANDLAVLPNDPRANADFVPKDEGTAAPGMWSIDYLLTEHQADGKFVERYGHYSPVGAAMPPILLTDATVMLTSSDIEIEDVTYLPVLKKTYAYIGNPMGTLREYALDDGTTAGQVKARTVGNALMMDFAGRTNGFLVGLAEIGAPLDIRTTLMPVAKLGAFKPSDVPIAGTFAGTADLPAGDPTIRWVGDVLVMIGGQGVKGTDIGYLMFDSSSRQRGAGTAPFTVMLDATKTRTSVHGVSWSAIGSPNFDKIGGDVMVTWAETQTKNNVGYDVIYFDRLKCATVSNGG